MDRSAVCAAVAALLAGCINPGVYGGARTLKAGADAYVLSLDFQQSTDGDSAIEDRPLPRVAYRRGLADRLEIGVQTAAYPTIGVDLKWQLLDERRVAIAIAPTIAYSWLPAQRLNDFAEWRLPLLLQIDLADPVALVPSFGIGSWIHGEDEIFGELGLVYGGALGLRVDTGGFVLQPEVGLFDSTEDGPDGLVTFGVAFTFGED